MAPEQLSREIDPLPAAVDVFSLSVILYELLTGQLPFGSGDDYRERVAGEPPVPPIELRPAVGRDLNAICLKGLERLENRYPSAGALADDLLNAIEGRPVTGDRPMRRFLKWSRRHRSAVSILVGSVMLLIYLATSLPEVVKEAELRLANTVREHIEFAAKAQAGAALNEVRTRVERVTNMLRDPEVIALHAHGDLFDPPRALQRHAEGFDSVFILTLKGSPVARYPQPRPEYAGRGFGGRDYVKRAQRLLERGLDGVQVSRLFESVADGDIKLAYSAVLRRDDGEPVGILAATTSARSTFGSLTMQCPGAIGCTTYLFGPPDAAPGVAEPPQNELLLVAGKGLEKGKRTQLPEQVAAEVCAAIGCGSTTLDQFAAREGQESFVYTGDIPGITNGPSLTAFASVAQTGLVVAVAVPQKEALASVRNLRQRLRENLYAPLGLGIVLFLALTLDWSGLQMWLARRWTSRSR